jgi:hypothetical protein
MSGSHWMYVSRASSHSGAPTPGIDDAGGGPGWGTVGGGGWGVGSVHDEGGDAHGEGEDGGGAGG